MAKVNPIPNRSFLRLDAHYRFYVSLVVAAVAFFTCFKTLSIPAAALMTWSAFALTVIVLDWLIILMAHPKEIRKVASLEDSSRTLLFVFVIAASLASLVAILFLLKSSKNLSEATITGHILLSMGAVFISWWLVHTLFTMRYAHLYYSTDPDGAGKKLMGGLDFPGDEKEPDYLDFVYFAFVLGTTFQVSDVEISSRRIRRIALVHGLIAFAFNTAILALSINVVSGLVSK